MVTSTVKALKIVPLHTTHSFAVSEITLPIDAEACFDIDRCCAEIGCDTFSMVAIPDGPLRGHTVVCDDNGLSAQPPGLTHSDALTAGHFLAGTLLLLGDDGLGGSTDARIDAAALIPMLQGAYVTRGYARDLMAARQAQIQSQYPDVIVVDGAGLLT